MTIPDSRRSIPDRIAFIGGGNMARSLIGGLIARGARPQSICVAEPQSAARQALTEEFGVRTHASNVEAVKDARLVLLAVKPQVMRAVCEEVRGQLGEAVAVSIAAGITCAQLQHWLGATAGLVRCMPNTPALLGAGATGLFATTSTSNEARAAAAAVLGAVGLCVWIDDEAQMDAVTAVSGSGPAYVFLLAEAMEDAGVQIGLPAPVARDLVRQTLLGAARMLSEGDDSAATLRQRVTSPGGTTQAAIERFEAGDLRALVHAAIAAAQQRGGELSRALGDVA